MQNKPFDCAQFCANTLVKGLHREHNVVERGIGWFKQYHRLTMHFEKIASTYLVVAVHHWLQNPFAANVHTP